MKSWVDWKTMNRPYKELIHPSGGISELAYNNSGKKIALEVAEHKEPWMGFPPRILEYGCGDGRVLRHFKGFNGLCGVDLVPEFVEKAKEELQYNNIFTLEELPFDSFEIVFSVSVFIHLNDKDSKDALHYIYDKLTPKGLALLQMPVYQSHTAPSSFMDVRTWTRESLTHLVSDVGFEVVKIKANPGVFSYDREGLNHNFLQVFRKQ